MKILLDSIVFSRIDVTTKSDTMPEFETLGIRVNYTVYFSHTNELTGCITLEWTGVIDENKIIQIIKDDLKNKTR